MPFPENGKMWADGKLIPWKEAKIHSMSHVVHYGSGVFEGIRCYDTKIGTAVFRLPEHIKRLFESALVYKIKIPYTIEQIVNACLETIRANGLKACYIRPVAFLGYETLGVFPRNNPTNIHIGVWEWAPYLGSEGLEKGVRVMITGWVKFHSSMMPTMAKACGQYLNSMLAVKDARDKGFDEAILLNQEGHIAEGTGENIFIIKNGILYTNDATQSVLMGITRDSIITIAKDLGYEVVVKPISKGELYTADESFFTGSAAEVTPIRNVDDRDIGSGKPGSITLKLQSAFFDVVYGKNEKYLKWLTKV